MQHLPSPLIFLALLTAECWVRPPISCLSSNRQHRRAFGALAALVNITVDDTSSEILYTPAESWHASTIPCSNCLSPGQDLAFQGTWHDGTHIIPTVDGDDINNQEGLGSLTSSLVPSAALPSPSNTNEGKHGDGDDDGGDGDEKKGDDRDTDKHQSKRKLQRREAVALRKRWPSPSRSDLEENPFLTPNLDSDDAGFVDNPVMAQFNFTGSAVYVFALIPLFAAPANTTPTFVNLTYTLDGQAAGDFNHSGTQSPSASGPSPDAFQQSVLVFAESGLPEGPHVLTMIVGPDSVLLLDFIIYSQDSDFSNGGNGTQNISSTSESASPASTASGLPGSRESSSQDRAHNIATFAGAVGGSVGLLALLSLSLAFSIYRRRVLSRRRDRRYREARTRASDASLSDSFHTNGSEDGPPMQGPEPFVPRYFPGTVPTAPPAYTPSATHSDATTALLSSPSPVSSPIGSIAWFSSGLGISADGDTSYADRPPPTPPLGDDGYFAPPPPFPIAVATPIPAILARFSNMPSTSTSPPPVPLLPPPPPPPFQLSPPMSRRSSQRTIDSQMGFGRGGTSDLPNLENIPDRPPSSASEIPPLIPPPIEFVRTEQEAHGHGARGSYVVNPSLL